NNGTPNFFSIDWRGALSRSVIALGYHYETKASGRAGPDRQAFGTLVAFRRWSTRKEGSIDMMLNQQGLFGNHGDRRQFSFGGSAWRVYEAQGQFGEDSRWHIFLYDLAQQRMLPL